MGRRADIMLTQTTALIQHEGSGTQYLIQTPSGVLYCILVVAGSDVGFKKSTDGGVTWGPTTLVFTGTVTQLSVWYDRWSGIAGGLIHMAYTESVTDDTLYRTINTESSDALSTQTTIFAGTSTAAGCNLSITRARGGNVYCRTTIDAGAEGGFFRLPNANVPNGAWDAARANPEALATLDQIILVPGFAADNQDIIGIFLDASADELSRYIHDDSANTWAETSIATGIADLPPASGHPTFAAAVDLENNRIIVVAWTATDTANADLRCWTITESAITETSTNVVLNSTDDQGLCAVCLDITSTDWYVFYVGKSDGSETFSTSVQIYYKVSKDDGATWGPETLLSTSGLNITRWLITVPRLYRGAPVVAYHWNTADPEIRVNVDRTVPRASSLVGVM